MYEDVLKLLMLIVNLELQVKFPNKIGLDGTRTFPVCSKRD